LLTVLKHNLMYQFFIYQKVMLANRMG
jgi:hypothetical protein